MALIAVFLAVFKDWRKYLSPGERAIVLLVAADREQAKILHRYCQGILSPPILQSLVLNVTASEIEFKGGVTIEVVTRSYRTVRGASVCVAVLDELAFWRDDDSGKSGQRSFERCPRQHGDVWLRRDGDCRPSPYARRGVLWDAFRRWYGKDDARNLVWQAATRTMNPTVSQEFVDAEFERDPASAACRVWRKLSFATLPSLFDLACLRLARPMVCLSCRRCPARLTLLSAIRPAVQSDSMTLAIAHHDDGVAVLDCVREVRAPFQPESVVADFCTTLAAYRRREGDGRSVCGRVAARAVQEAQC